MVGGCKNILDRAQNLPSLTQAVQTTRNFEVNHKRISMGNVRVRIMIMKSGHDRIFFEEEHGGPGQAPVPQTNFEVSCTTRISVDLLKGKLESVYTARCTVTVFLFLLVVCCRPGNACT